MCKICPKCKSIAEYNAYYGRVTCTSCSWESDDLKKEKQLKFKIKPNATKKYIHDKLLKA